MTKLLLAVSVLIALIAPPCLASGKSTDRSVVDMSGSELLGHCSEGIRFVDGDNKASAAVAAQCFQYIRGFADGYAIAAALAKMPDAERMCIPSSVSLEQLGRVVKKYLEDHPANLHENAAYLTLAALRQSFPCSE